MRRQYYLVDIFKVIFALLVVSIHVYPLMQVSEAAHIYVTMTIGRMAVPFFLVASSFFLFKKLNLELPARSEHNTKILKNYLWNLLKLYLIWCGIYFIFTLIQWIKDDFSFFAVLTYIRNLIFTGGSYHLWFLPAMIVSTLIVYVLLYSSRRNKIFKTVLILYLIGAVFNLYKPLMQNIPIISSIIRVYEAIFVTTRNGIFMGPIFTWMGYYIANNRFSDDKKWLVKAILISLSLLLIESTIYHYVFKINNDLACMYFSLVPLTFYLFNLLVKFEKSHTKIKMSFVRNMSTLIYLDHIIFVNILPIDNALIKYGFVVLFSMILGAMIIIGSSYIPKLKELY